MDVPYYDNQPLINDLSDPVDIHLTLQSAKNEIHSPNENSHLYTVSTTSTKEISNNMLTNPHKSLIATSFTSDETKISPYQGSKFQLFKKVINYNSDSSVFHQNQIEQQTELAAYLKQENQKLLQIIQTSNHDRKILEGRIDEMFADTECLIHENNQLCKSNDSFIETNTDLTKSLDHLKSLLAQESQATLNQVNRNEIQLETTLLKQRLKDVTLEMNQFESEVKSKDDRLEYTSNQLINVKFDNENLIKSLEQSIVEQDFVKLTNKSLIDESSTLNSMIEQYQIKMNKDAEDLIEMKSSHSKVREQHIIETIRLNQIILEFSDDKRKLELQIGNQVKGSLDRTEILQNENDILIAQLKELSLRHIAMNEEKLVVVDQLETEKKHNSK